MKIPVTNIHAKFTTTPNNTDECKNPTSLCRTRFKAFAGSVIGSINANFRTYGSDISMGLKKAEFFMLKCLI